MSQISPQLLLRNGITAAKTGNRVQARQALLRVSELDPNNELAWLWLASVAESLAEGQRCLRRVIEINPANTQAAKGLEIVEARLAQETAHQQCPFCQSVIEQDDKCTNCHDLLVQRQVTAWQTTKNAMMTNSAQQKTILVVDDSATICKLVTITLDKHGYRVICAPDGLEGLSYLNDVHPSLILLDITMPRMDGYQLCRIVKGNPATLHIPVVMLSGKDGFFDKVRGRAAGATDYITKPFEPDTLLQIVRKCLDGDPTNHSKSQTNLDGDQEKAVRSVA